MKVPALIVPGHDRPEIHGDVRALAARLAQLAQGQAITLAPITATYPGHDTFRAVKCTAPIDGGPTWFATAAGPGVDPRTLAAALAALAPAGAA